MEMTTGTTIRADRMAIYRLAAAVEDWPRLLPHYRSVRVLQSDGRRRLVAMAARRGRWPVWWWAEQVCDPQQASIAFRHVRGITTGMVVEWRFAMRADGSVEVAIWHRLDLAWPLIGRPIAERIIGPHFIDYIAGQTLHCIKRLAETPGPAQPAAPLVCAAGGGR